MKIFCAIIFGLICLLFSVKGSEEDCARDYVEYLNGLFKERRNSLSNAAWDYCYNVTKETELNLLKVQEKASRESKEERFQLMKFKWREFKDEDLKRQIHYFILDIENVLPTGKFYAFEKIIATMKQIYVNSNVISYKNHSKSNLNLQDISEIFSVSRDPEELKYIWIKMRDSVGPQVRKYYPQYVTFLNEAGRLHEMSGASEMVLAEFGENIDETVQYLWMQVKNLYEQLHGYVRHNLREIYGAEVVKGRLIPAHLLGNPQAQTWEWLSKLFLPYKNRKMKLISDVLLEWTDYAKKRYRKIEKFYLSMNLTQMTNSFWEKSIFEQPVDGRSIICYPNTFDFFDGEDFRIIHCSTSLNQSFLDMAPSLIGDIEYAIQYRHQKPINREPANSAFSSGFGQWTSMSFYNSHNLVRLGIMEEPLVELEDKINKLFLSAMTTLPFLPYSYVMGLWRWKVFNGTIPPERYNCEYWVLVNMYQGLEAPVERSEEDFDIASKYQIVANERYLRHYLGTVLGFQMLKGLCIKGGEYNEENPQKCLHDCSIYGKTEAGNALKEMLELGRSKHWKDALQLVAGEREFNASAILEYYKPLLDWLVEENKRNNVQVGWEEPDTSCQN